MAECATPSYQQGLCLRGVAKHLLRGDVVRNPGNLLTTDIHHLGMIGGIGRYSPGFHILFKAAETVGKVIAAGNSPVARKGLRVAPCR